MLLQAMLSSTNTDKVSERILFALEEFANNLEEYQIVPHLKNVIPALIGVLSSNCTSAIKEQSLKA